MSKKAYFARPITQYNAPLDKWNIKQIKNLGFDIVDPNEFFTKEQYEQEGMKMFYRRIKHCDVLFFSARLNGKITAGVSKEAEYAGKLDIPVYEIPTGISHRTMSVEETRKYLKEKGVR